MVARWGSGVPRSPESRRLSCRNCALQAGPGRVKPALPCACFVLRPCLAVPGARLSSPVLCSPRPRGPRTVPPAHSVAAAFLAPSQPTTWMNGVCSQGKGRGAGSQADPKCEPALTRSLVLSESRNRCVVVKRRRVVWEAAGHGRAAGAPRPRRRGPDRTPACFAGRTALFGASGCSCREAGASLPGGLNGRG